MSEDVAVVEGIGVHSGMPSRVVLRRRPGPIRFWQNGSIAALTELKVVRNDRGVRLASRDSRVEVDVVEHLLAALGGMGIRRGLTVEVHGRELPFLDAASRAWTRALGALALRSSPPRLHVVRSASLEVEGSRFDFAPEEGVSLAVEVDFSGYGQAPQSAVWAGDALSFVSDIAPARSFGFLAEYDHLLGSGRAAGAIGSALLVFDAEGRQLDNGPPARPDELARHKLLDLIGDSYVSGGPAKGHVRAIRPGHARNILAFQLALTEGILEPAGR